jgi:ADP-ribose pyrophosphatase YjhB (NUDIX family)
MGQRNSHCSYCGASFQAVPWPRKCAACGDISYLNPFPVAVLLVPVDDGILTIRRGYGSSAGRLALPGGFIDMAESWQEAAARELFEESGVTVDASLIKDFWVRSAPDGTVLIFGRAAPCTEASLPPFKVTNETTERVIVKSPQELAFPLHTQTLDEFFTRQSS